MDIILNKKNQYQFNSFNKRKFSNIETYIAYLAFVVTMLFPLLGLGRENNFIFFALYISVLCLLSHRVAFKLFIIFLPLPFVATFGGLNTNLLDVISFCLLLHLFLNKDNPIPKQFIWFDRIIIFYYLFIFVYIANDGINIPRIIRYIVEPLIIFFSAKRIIKSKKDIYMITKLLIIGTLLSSIVCIYQFTNIFDVPAWNEQYTSMVNYGIYPTFSSSYSQSENLFYRRPGGFFQYGAELATFIPIIIYLILFIIKDKKIKGIHFYILSTILAVLFIALVLTTVRGMVFAFLLSIIIYLFMQSKNKIAMFIIIPSLIISISINFMPQYMQDRYLLKTRSETMTSRFRLINKSLNEIRNKPKIFFFGGPKPKSHNVFVDELYSKGLMGFIIYLTLKYKILKYSLIKRKGLFLIPLLVFWFITGLTTGSPYGTFHTHFLFPIILILSIMV